MKYFLTVTKKKRMDYFLARRVEANSFIVIQSKDHIREKEKQGHNK